MKYIAIINTEKIVHRILLMSLSRRQNEVQGL